jgi:hypothetical protein
VGVDDLRPAEERPEAKRTSEVELVPQLEHAGCDSGAPVRLGKPLVRADDVNVDSGGGDGRGERLQVRDRAASVGAGDVDDSHGSGGGARRSR